MTHGTNTSEALDGFHAVVERLPDGVLVHRDGTILYANEAAAELFGHRHPRDLVGTKLKAVMAPGDGERLAERIRRIMDTGERSAWIERSIRRIDGTLVSVEVSGTRVSFGGAPAILGLFRDVSERRALTARMMQLDRAISAGTLAAGVGHEINNPLAFVSANLEWLDERLRAGRSRAGDVIDDEVLSVLDDCQIGARRIRDIVRGLQTFARADEPLAGPIDICPIIDSALSMAGSELKHRAEVVCEYDGAAFVNAQESRLAQVFLNLIVNAAHAIREGARTSNEVRIRTRTDGGSVLVSISDTGAGISPADLPRIFDPFFTTKAVGEGTGLGLAISHDIVTRLGGELTVASTLGNGATFQVRLPLAKSAEPSSPPAATTSAVAVPRRGRFLVIDDEVMLGAVFRRLLAEHEIIFVEGGAAAIELLDRGEMFDAIFLDLMMPDVSGMDVYAHVAESRPALLPRIIAMTGGAYTPASRDLVSRLATLPLRKPVAANELRERVAEMLR